MLKWDGGRCGSLSVQSGSEPFGLWGRYKWYQSRPSWPRTHAGQGRGHGVHCLCRPCGVHGMAHVPALGARLRVLRGNVPGHRLPGCGCVGPMRTSVHLRGCM